ncbi:polyketide cyclase / dehydrase and lipid transport domain containing protein [Nitzschia inconspicua]|uniref:Polyketide cyclase / dehydrase and lipid transport domain containing protein n=1 Tax=Nitzschia inconspicua TaxID=303405 RepID=A0A9K3L3T9_9STRA|nr:polyketide cyclase / dehydrase and lipid transport domain containing protein [Nitzschia inconspicua]
MSKVQKSTLYYPDRAPVRLQLEVDLQSSPEDVWKALLDYPSWPKWFPNVKSCFETTPLPKVADNNPSYPLGSTRRIDIGGVVFDEEIIAYDDGSSLNDKERQPKVWAFSVYETSQPILNCAVERVVLEPLYKENDESGTTVVGTRVRYAGGMDVVWYLPFLKPILKRNMNQAWKQGLERLDQYISMQQNK